MIQPPRFEIGDTRQFTFVTSVTPGTTPIFTVFAGSGDAVVVYSGAAQSSGSGMFYSYFTIPNSTNALYTWQWVASYTAGPIVDRGSFQGVRTGVWG